MKRLLILLTIMITNLKEEDSRNKYVLSELLLSIYCAILGRGFVRTRTIQSVPCLVPGPADRGVLPQQQSTQ